MDNRSNFIGALGFGIRLCRTVPGCLGTYSTGRRFDRSCDPIDLRTSAGGLILLYRENEGGYPITATA